MKYNIQDKVFQKCIEAPRLQAEANGSIKVGNNEKETYYDDFAQRPEKHANEHFKYGLDIYKRFDENELWEAL